MPDLHGKTIAIRADAAFEIGTGHVMRMLSLARGLTESGAHIVFIARDIPGHMHAAITAAGYTLKSLPPTPGHIIAQDNTASWLGAPIPEDLRQTFSDNFGPDITIVDHYGADIDWCHGARAHTGLLVCIDDEALRPLSCDMLVNQNYFHDMAVPARQQLPAVCTRLIGPAYAMLRPEFSRLRPSAPTRTSLNNILILMGGRDVNNIGLRILHHMPENLGCAVTVIGGNADTQSLCATRGFTFKPSSNTIADDMLNADLCFGAAGSTSWERCCLGLPAALFVIADNQSAIARNLELSGACLNLGDFRNFNYARIPQILADLKSSPLRLAAMSTAAAQLTDGHGVERIISALQSA